MASCYSTRWQRFCHKCFPFLYKKCPEGNYHSVFDRLCYCRLQQYSNEWNGGILDLKTGKEYIPAFQYTQIVNKYNRLCEAARKADSYMAERKISKDFSVRADLRRALGIKDENDNKVFIGTMDGFPEGWERPKQLREKGFQKKKEDVKDV